MAQKAGHNGPKAGQKEGLAGQRPKSRAWQGALPKAGQFGSYGSNNKIFPWAEKEIFPWRFYILFYILSVSITSFRIKE